MCHGSTTFYGLSSNSGASLFLGDDLVAAVAADGRFLLASPLLHMYIHTCTCIHYNYKHT